MNKTCTKCKIEKSFEEFYIRKDRKSSYDSCCKKCKCNKTIEWQLNNKDKKYSYQKNYRESDKGKANVVGKQRKRRAILKNSLHPKHDKQFEKVLDNQRIRLERCLGIRFAIDHILPLAQGGSHHHNNLQIIPATLNNRKLDSLDYKHELLIHWTELPDHLINWK